LTAKKSLAERKKPLKELDKKLSKSTLTETEAIELGRKVNRALSRKFYKS